MNHTRGANVCQMQPPCVALAEPGKPFCVVHRNATPGPMPMPYAWLKPVETRIEYDEDGLPARLYL